MHFPLLGLLGGAFDPVHNGHLAVATHLLPEMHLTSLHFIPTGCPPHRQAFIANATQRITMLKLALQDNAKFHNHDANFIVNTIEIQRSQMSPLPTYTVDTLTSLRPQFPHHSLCLILGYDAWLHFSEWHHWQTILTLAHLVIVNRPDSPGPTTTQIQNILAQHQTQQISQLSKQQAGCILLHPIPPSPISATHIRQQLKQGINLTLTTDLPPSVLDYIYQHHLYE